MSVACGQAVAGLLPRFFHDRDVDPATIHSLANARAQRLD